MLQETVADFEVRCCAWQRLHQARRGVHSRVQAAAAARVAGGPDIVDSAENGDGVSVLCHVIADADAVNKRVSRDDIHWQFPPTFTTPLCRAFIFIMFMQQIDSFAFLQSKYSTAFLC